MARRWQAGTSIDVKGRISEGGQCKGRRTVSATRLYVTGVDEFDGVRETPIHHHRPQLGHADLCEEQPRMAVTDVRPHQAASNQPLYHWRELRLPGLGSAPPSLELKAVGHPRVG